MLVVRVIIFFNFEALNTVVLVIVLMVGMVLQVNDVELENVLTKGAYMLLYARYRY